jgi:hypothetical protein
MQRAKLGDITLQEDFQCLVTADRQKTAAANVQHQWLQLPLAMVVRALALVI